MHCTFQAHFFIHSLQTHCRQLNRTVSISSRNQRSTTSTTCLSLMMKIGSITL